MSEEADKTAGILAKIKAKQWKEMGKTVTQMKDFAEANVIESFLDGLKETWRLQVDNALSPLTNEVTTMITEALEPIMPMITDTINELTVLLTRGMGALTALLTGKWDSWIKEETVRFQKDVIENLEGPLREAHNMIQKFRFMVEKGQLGEALALGWEGFWRDVERGLGSINWSGVF